jgi:ribonuclease-3
MLTLEKLNALSQKLGHTFRDSTPLMTALTHRSFIHERPSHVYPTNERMEFLGDAILNLMVAEELFNRHAELPEGQLSKLRSFAVNEDTLASMARHLNLGSFMFLGRGEEKQIEGKDAILADAMEAILAAIYQESDLASVKTAWLRWQEEMGIDLLDPRNLEEFDAKSRLQEYCMKSWQELPSYDFIEARTPSSLTFKVTLLVHGRPLLSTQNISKKKAELWLAKTCLQNHLHLTLG